MIKNNYSSYTVSYRIKALLELSNKNIEYALIREPKISDPDGDIDILVNNITRTDILLQKIGYNLFLKTRNNAKYLKYDLEYKKWIHLDVQSSIQLGDFWTPKNFTQILLETSLKDKNGINKLNYAHEIIITIFHVAVSKGHFDKEYQKRIFTYNLELLYQYERQYDFLPEPLSVFINKMIKMQNNTLSEKEVINFFQKKFKSKKNVLNLFLRIINRFKSLFKLRRGIAILGPDGSGKSSLTIPLSHLMWPQTRRQYMGPSSEVDTQPFFFKLETYFASKRKQLKKNNPVGIICQFFWIFICYIDFWERYLRHIWFYGSGGIVFFDRYPWDMYFRKPSKLNKIVFFNFFPRPRFIYLCVGDENLIYKRKKEEVNPIQIKNTIDLYRKTFLDNSISFIEIDTIKLSQLESINTILKHSIKNNWFY